MHKMNSPARASAAEIFKLISDHSWSQKLPTTLSEHKAKYLDGSWGTPSVPGDRAATGQFRRSAGMPACLRAPRPGSQAAGTGSRRQHSSTCKCQDPWLSNRHALKRLSWRRVSAHKPQPPVYRQHQCLAARSRNPDQEADTSHVWDRGEGTGAPKPPKNTINPCLHATECAYRSTRLAAPPRRTTRTMHGG
jgi:hypothetical protein